MKRRTKNNGSDGGAELFGCFPLFLLGLVGGAVGAGLRQALGQLVILGVDLRHHFIRAAAIRMVHLRQALIFGFEFLEGVTVGVKFHAKSSFLIDQKEQSEYNKRALSG